LRREDYLIRGGVEGRERLKVLSRIMRPSSHSLLERVGIRPGMRCLEIGCGSGDLAFDMARLVGPAGKVIGTDIDHEKLELVRQEAAELQLDNTEFQFADITETEPAGEFDLIHARFVLTHLADPVQALRKMRAALRSRGVLVVEDIDFRGHFSYPESPALQRYVELYTESARRKGGDANIGPRLPALLAESGLENVQVNLLQPVAMAGELKLIAPITMENIAHTLVADGLASQTEIQRIVEELYEYARAPGTLVSGPRIVEAWGYQSLHAS
jgi:ubiquinone/menaquinone biosynthesis C-methylase UbiE